MVVVRLYGEAESARPRHGGRNYDRVSTPGSSASGGIPAEITVTTTKLRAGAHGGVSHSPRQTSSRPLMP